MNIKKLATLTSLALGAFTGTVLTDLGTANAAGTFA